MAYEMVMPYHLHMPSYFLETFTEYPYLVALFNFTLLLMACLKKKSVTYNRLRSLWYKKECSYFFSCFSGRGSNTL